jgi:hypothetical protein
MIPTGPITPEDYLRDRVQDQERWYSQKARAHERTRVLLSWLIGSANVLAAGLALLSIFASSVEAWLGVATTLVGLFTTYSAMTAADYLASSYAATARQLADLDKAWREGQYGGEAEDFRRFVRQVEQAISREHGGWTAVLRHVTKHSH